MPTSRDESIVIQPSTYEDMIALGRFGVELMSLHHHWDNERFIAPDKTTPAAYAAYLAKQSARAEVIFLVAWHHDRAVGYSYAEMKGFDYMALCGPAGVVHDIFVEPSQRRLGIGGKLVDATISALAALEAQQVVLSTTYRNEAAQRLFASAGLRPTMIEMTLTLRSPCSVPK
ncbi:hypothetical protein ADU59_28845 [Pararhizobium polonicum]|uniref:N-acetyltransferase domain-containing protein n=1 Tax=Pararhizobium polonicum TaxID=1612624 RepID=A0A1C7NSV6_9HYPH|nr:GNAT family N-acetyltransferase [Pararhizobium polonicum]OBZ92057.1 hypothetical protein ADU59_28845 [Pararhizobium polonicum]